MPKIKIVDNLTSEIAVVPINNSGFSIQTYESSFLIGPFKWSPAFRADWWQLKRAQGLSGRTTYVTCCFRDSTYGLSLAQSFNAVNPLGRLPLQPLSNGSEGGEKPFHVPLLVCM
ncbi:unnamed protein product [Allacma fusca]|uniref:Uncharacterized protein n=1 Tax=Allacma fusca TaxID=39272 RepID=A0A8J2KNU1_9HEXA|nr:unnamed protein product [Allacma fusca]